MTPDERKRGLRAAVDAKLIVWARSRADAFDTIRATPYERALLTARIAPEILWDVIDSLVDECAAHEQHIQEILLRAYKYDDKPHQLFSGIAALARAYPGEDTAAIIQLMDIAYVHPVDKGGK